MRAAACEDLSFRMDGFCRPRVHTFNKNRPSSEGNTDLIKSLHLRNTLLPTHHFPEADGGKIILMDCRVFKGE